jgi:hypothetical protein
MSEEGFWSGAGKTALNIATVGGTGKFEALQRKPKMQVTVIARLGKSTKNFRLGSILLEFCGMRQGVAGLRG